MGKPTREEIRTACEAVGWGWNERRVAVGEETAAQDFDFAIDSTSGLVWWFLPYKGRYEEDAIALLEATDCTYTIDRHLRPEKAWSVYMEDAGTISASAEGATLHEAAVHAVLAWAHQRDAEREWRKRYVDQPPEA